VQVTIVFGNGSRGGLFAAIVLAFRTRRSHEGSAGIIPLLSWTHHPLRLLRHSEEVVDHTNSVKEFHGISEPFPLSKPSGIAARPTEVWRRR